MTRSISLALCLAAVLSAGGAFAQAPDAQTDENATETTSAPVAHVYINSGTKILAYSAAANGKLTSVPGSPFNFNISLSGANGHYLFGFVPNSLTIESLSMAANGALKKATTLNTASHNAVPDCALVDWNGQGLRVDHSGLELYNAAIPGDFPCDTYFQSYRINDSDGALTFQSNALGALGGSASLSVLGNNKFAYSPNCFAAFGNSPYPTVGVFERMGNGELADTSSGVDIPAPPDDTHNPNQGPTPGYFCPMAMATDPTNHAAMTLYALEQNAGEDGGNPNYGLIYIATYTADAEGNLKTTSTYKNMATLPVDNLFEGDCLACSTLRMAPSGKILAAGGSAGALLFHFNGGSPATKYKTLLAGNNIGQILWDNDNHMYALGSDSKGAQKLWVYTVTPTSTTEAPGSPYSMTNAGGMYIQPIE
jgi:hypothetical protein